MFVVFFFQAEDGIRDLVRSRGLGDVYKRQTLQSRLNHEWQFDVGGTGQAFFNVTGFHTSRTEACLLYTSDAADDLLCVDLGGRRIIKKKKKYTLQR